MRNFQEIASDLLNQADQENQQTLLYRLVSQIAILGNGSTLDNSDIEFLAQAANAENLNTYLTSLAQQDNNNPVSEGVNFNTQLMTVLWLAHETANYLCSQGDYICAYIVLSSYFSPHTLATANFGTQPELSDSLAKASNIVFDPANVENQSCINSLTHYIGGMLNSSLSRPTSPSNFSLGTSRPSSPTSGDYDPDSSFSSFSM